MLQYTRTQAGRTRSVERLECRAHTAKTTVVTVVEPNTRRLLDTISTDAFTCVHVARTSEAIGAAQEGSARVVLLSPSVLQREAPAAVRQLVSQNPGVIVIAVVDREGESSPSAMLSLGASGIRDAISLGDREGLQKLRRLLADSGSECTTRILDRLLPAMGSAKNEAKSFFVTVARLAPRIATIRALSRPLGVHASSLLSRFHRAELPTPKAYLAMMRLLYAASYLEEPRVSVASVANCLGYSSPQAFCRHVNGILGVTAGEFRKRFTLETALDHYVERLIVPYEETLRGFDPLGPGPITPQRLYTSHRNPVRLAAER